MKPLYLLTVGLLAVSLMGHAASARAAEARRPLVVDDFYQVQTVGDPDVSPDGQWVAYVVTANERDSDEARSSIWMVSWDGAQRLALTGAADGNDKPRWSPDGRYLAYLATPAGSDKAQVMVMDRRGGAARQLTSTRGGVHDYQWSPDATRLVLVMEKGAEGPAQIRPVVIEAAHFKQDGDGYLGTDSARHLYLLDLAGKQLEPLTAASGFEEDFPAWSPDGSHIAFVRTRERGPDADGRADIDLIEARPGAQATTLTRPFAPNNQKLAWSPDGKSLAFLQGRELKLNAYMQDRLFTVPAAGGTPRALTDKLDRAVVSFVYADNSTIAVAVEDDGAVYPARIDLASGNVVRPAGAKSYVVSALASGGGHTALLQSNDGALAEVYALEGEQLRKLSAHNDAFMAQIQLGVVEEVRFNSKDSTEIHAFLIKPADFVRGRKYPLLLWIHGGPNGQDAHSLSLDGYEFEPQMFAAKGYAVLRVNYRGGSGRGAAFAQAILADWGHKEVEDLLAGVDYLINQGIVDKDRMAVGGWSYGGLLTDYIIASDRRFKAAISGAGSGNQLSTYGVDQYVLAYNNELGKPWTNTPLWLKVSYPFFHADRIHTPTLFLGGDKDFNVPIVGGEQMYQSLKTLGIPAQLVVYPGEHHVFTRPSFLIDLGTRMSGWLDRYVR